MADWEKEERQRGLDHHLGCCSSQFFFTGEEVLLQQFDPVEDGRPGSAAGVEAKTQPQHGAGLGADCHVLLPRGAVPLQLLSLPIPTLLHLMKAVLLNCLREGLKGEFGRLGHREQEQLAIQLLRQARGGSCRCRSGELERVRQERD
jgi:hypothetical protein